MMSKIPDQYRGVLVYYEPSKHDLVGEGLYKVVDTTSIGSIPHLVMLDTVEDNFVVVREDSLCHIVIPKTTNEYLPNIEPDDLVMLKNKGILYRVENVYQSGMIDVVPASKNFARMVSKVSGENATIVEVLDRMATSFPDAEE